MADIKISALTAKGANLSSTDRLAIAEVGGGSFNSKHVTGAEIITAANLVTARAVSSTSHTLALSDAHKFIQFDNGSAIAVTIPTNASVAFSIGTQILFSQHGAGQVTFAAAGGVTVRAAGGKLKTTAQYSMGSLIKIAADEWYITGDLTT